MVCQIFKCVYGGDFFVFVLFVDNMYYKVEVNVVSEFVGKMLWDSGLMFIYVSDNLVLNVQYVFFEVVKVYKYGLLYYVVFVFVIVVFVECFGFGQWLGKIKFGYDVDVVVWDSDLLSVGVVLV